MEVGWNSTAMPTEPEYNADVNGDGTVNIDDLIAAAAHYGGSDKAADVNGDGVVDVQDILLIVDAIHAGAGAAAAPSAYVRSAPDGLSAAAVQRWILDAENLPKSAWTERNIMKLTALLQALIQPRQTALLPNYPNPFNPETWIPFDLAESSRVTIAIYNEAGQTRADAGAGRPARRRLPRPIQSGALGRTQRLRRTCRKAAFITSAYRQARLHRCGACSC